jgi:hypothetical protein
MMFSLREHPRNLADLAAVAGMSINDAKNLLSLLAELEYVDLIPIGYRARIPVLTDQDGQVVQRLRRVGSEVMSMWLSENYADIKAQLSELTAVRHGVPYPVVFTQVWHYLFGTANRKLVKFGVFADPYAQSKRHKGFIPAVWHDSLRNLR